MRVLVATTANAGHFGPLVPFAQACAAAGHDVRVAAPASFADAVHRAELRHLAVDDVAPEELAAVFDRVPQLPLEEANAVVVRDVFAGIDARAALPRLAAASRDFRPDVILRETAEFASYVVAETQQVPHVQVAIGLASLDAFAHPLIDDALARLGAARGVAGLREAAKLSLVPPCLDERDAASGGPIHRYRYEAPTAASRGLPADWGDPDAPLVYATFGTVAANVGLYPSLYRAVIDATADLPIRLLLTIGESADPSELDPLPDNVHVERFWPQHDVMPQAATMIGHGGFGTTMLGLAHGIPMVTIPLFALDQHHNALAVARAGAGITLSGEPDIADSLGEAVRQTLVDVSYQANARSVAHEIARLPQAATSVSLLEDIAQG